MSTRERAGLRLNWRMGCHAADKEDEGGVRFLISEPRTP